jgi:hypothetical protein
MRISIDLETLATSNNATVSAIGIAIFDDEKILGYDAYYLDWCLNVGDVDPNTLRWWGMQDKQVRMDNLYGRSIPQEVAISISKNLKNANQIWANGPQFDLVILRNWYKTLKMEAPWHYRVERDCRTLFEIGRKLNASVPEVKNKHDCMQDAIWQAQYVLNIESIVYNKTLPV